jgi:L-cysteate sulfo-lyase
MLNQQKRDDLRERLGSVERVSLARLPTPLVELPNLSRVLSGPKIFMKRDDLTGGLTFGGNKTRMLEFRLAPAVRRGADVIVSGFGVQSNHARQIAAAARKLGMDVELILRRTPYEPLQLVQGNLLIDLLLGATVRIVDATTEEQARMIADREAQLRAAGRRPYQTGFHDEDLSAVAYAGCALELHDQFEELGIEPDFLFAPSEGATQAGLHLFHSYVESTCRVVGVNMVDWVPDIRARIASIASAAAVTLGIIAPFEPADITNHEIAYRGSAYGMPTDEGLEAIRLVAETQGILLEPVYTAKAMAGLIDQIRTGVLGAGQTVVFLHTGGIPALFCYADVFDFADQLRVDP